MKLIFACLLLLTSITVFADPAPFGLEIGKATVEDAKKMYSIEKIGSAEYHKGSVYKAAVNQVDFEGLKELTLAFNENGVLSGVIATLPKTQFKSLHQSLSKKYKVVRQEIPFVGDSYTEYVNGSTNISLDAPHLSFDMSMIYMNKEMLAEVAAKLKAEAAAKKKSQEDKL